MNDTCLKRRFRMLYSRPVKSGIKAPKHYGRVSLHREMDSRLRGLRSKYRPAFSGSTARPDYLRCATEQMGALTRPISLFAPRTRTGVAYGDRWDSTCG